MKKDHPLYYAKLIIEEILEKPPTTRHYRNMMVITLAYRKILKSINENICSREGWPCYDEKSPQGRYIIAKLFEQWEEYVRKRTDYPLNLKMYQPDMEKIFSELQPTDNEENIMLTLHYRKKMEKAVLDDNPLFSEIHLTCINDRRFHEDFMTAYDDWEEGGLGTHNFRAACRNRIVRAIERAGFSKQETKIEVFPILWRKALLNQILCYYEDHLKDPEHLEDLWDFDADSAFLTSGVNGQPPAGLIRGILKNPAKTQSSNPTEKVKTMKTRDYSVPAIEIVPFVYGTDARILSDADIASMITDMEGEIKALNSTEHQLDSQKARVDEIRSHIRELVEFANKRHAEKNGTTQQTVSAPDADAGNA